MKSIAQQTDAELGGSWSVLVRQKRDHVELDHLLEDVLATTGPDQDAALRRLARLVFPHAFAEESVLWPEVRRCLPEGQALTLRVELEHQEVNDLWLRLDTEQLPEPVRQQIIHRLAEVLREDVLDEEDSLLPRLQESVDATRLRRLGLRWEATRRAAPTRPHPLVSRRPPGNVLAALPLTLLDRAQDRLDSTAERAPRAAEPIQRTSRALGRLSVRLEHFPPLRQGESPLTRRGVGPASDVRSRRG